MFFSPAVPEERRGALGRAPLSVPTAAFEVLAYLAVVAVATLCFLTGWLSPNGAVVLTAILLATLLVLSWIHLGRGRHPCFLFLGTLVVFQGGRLVGYCLGVQPDPLRVEAMSPNPFSLTRDEQGIVLLCLALSALCVYAPCRWRFRYIPPPDAGPARHYLPYLYLLFVLALPVQVFKNYRYYEYVHQHGGYAIIFANHESLTASVPFLVRVIPLISFPVFVAIFVFEQRRTLRYLATAVYFASASLILLLGSRMATFSLVLALWYVARIKFGRRTRILPLIALGLALVLIGDAVRQLRENPDEQLDATFAPIKVLANQGLSLNVTEVVVKFKHHFSPYAVSYLARELQNAFIANDATNYSRGRTLGFDITVFLSPVAVGQGYGTSTAYLAEAYVIGGLGAVLLISLLLGCGLNVLYELSGRILPLFLVAMVLPDVLLMPRGALLDWVSVLLRNGISLVLLWFGWKIYRLLTSIRPIPLKEGLTST